jgi:hypothetical protein
MEAPFVETATIQLFVQVSNNDTVISLKEIPARVHGCPKGKASDNDSSLTFGLCLASTDQAEPDCV